MFSTEGDDIMKSNTATLCYIREQTSFPEDYANQFGYKVTDKGNRFYVEFNGILQSFGVMNRNRRMYQAENVMNCIRTDPFIVDQLKLNKWMGEMDHPDADIEGSKLTMQRICKPDYTRTTHYVRSPRLEGNLLKAHIQTDSSNEHGMNMAIKIVDGKIVPGFSARTLGELKHISGQPTVFVKKLIAYDFVPYQSHYEALAEIHQPHMESVKTIEHALNDRVIFFDELAKMVANNDADTQLLCESFGLTIDDVVGITESGSSLIIKEKQNLYAQPVTDRILRARAADQLNEWLHQ